MSDATDTAAWWGAIVATIVLLWDIYKWWRSGARLIVRANPNMQDVSKLARGSAHDLRIFVDVTNSGDRPTTITHLVVYHYSNLFHKLANKPSMQGVVSPGDWGPPTPHVLQPGERWTSGIDQKDLTKKAGTDGYLYCGVIHSLAKRPVLARLKMADIKAGK